MSWIVIVIVFCCSECFCKKSHMPACLPVYLLRDRERERERERGGGQKEREKEDENESQRLSVSKNGLLSIYSIFSARYEVKLRLLLQPLLLPQPPLQQPNRAKPQTQRLHKPQALHNPDDPELVTKGQAVHSLESVQSYSELK